MSVLSYAHGSLTISSKTNEYIDLILKQLNRKFNENSDYEFTIFQSELDTKELQSINIIRTDTGIFYSTFSFEAFCKNNFRRYVIQNSIKYIEKLGLSDFFELRFEYSDISEEDDFVDVYLSRIKSGSNTLLIQYEDMCKLSERYTLFSLIELDTILDPGNITLFNFTTTFIDFYENKSNHCVKLLQDIYNSLLEELEIESFINFENLTDRFLLENRFDVFSKDYSIDKIEDISDYYSYIENYSDELLEFYENLNNVMKDKGI